MRSPAGAAERATLASRTHKFGPDHPETLAARRAYHRARGLSQVRAIAADPVLTDTDRAELAAVLGPGSLLAVSA